jgi:hypothetical protein
MKKKLPIFTTPEGLAKYMAAYEAMFSLWKVPYDSIDVQTGYGSTLSTSVDPTMDILWSFCTLSV